MASKPKKPKRGRPVVGKNRRPRNVQMTDEAYALLQCLGAGRAADGLEIALQRALEHMESKQCSPP